jgi:hypothetical protein
MQVRAEDKLLMTLIFDQVYSRKPPLDPLRHILDLRTKGCGAPDDVCRAVFSIYEAQVGFFGSGLRATVCSDSHHLTPQSKM